MKYEHIKVYADEKFRRIAGVKRSTFEKMLEILRPEKEKLTAKGGSKPKLRASSSSPYILKSKTMGKRK